LDVGRLHRGDGFFDSAGANAVRAMGEDQEPMLGNTFGGFLLSFCCDK
jgi:hypothetical protein